jgi:hypothetical protein
MDRLTLLIKNRLLLAGVPAFEAPYAARDAIALGRELGITEDGDVVRLAVIAQEIGPTLRAAPEQRDLVFAVLQRRDVMPTARLDFIERTWLSQKTPAEGG